MPPFTPSCAGSASGGRVVGALDRGGPGLRLASDAVDAGDQVFDMAVETQLPIDGRQHELGVHLERQERLDERQRGSLLRQVDAADALDLQLPGDRALEHLFDEVGPMIVGVRADVPRPPMPAGDEALERGRQAQRRLGVARQSLFGHERGAHGPRAVVGELLPLAGALARDDGVQAAELVRRGPLAEVPPVATGRQADLAVREREGRGPVGVQIELARGPAGECARPGRGRCLGLDQERAAFGARLAGPEMVPDEQQVAQVHLRRGLAEPYLGLLVHEDARHQGRPRRRAGRQVALDDLGQAPPQERVLGQQRHECGLARRRPFVGRALRQSVERGIRLDPVELRPGGLAGVLEEVLEVGGKCHRDRGAASGPERTPAPGAGESADGSNVRRAAGRTAYCGRLDRGLFPIGRPSCWQGRRRHRHGLAIQPAGHRRPPEACGGLRAAHVNG